MLLVGCHAVQLTIGHSGKSDLTILLCQNNLSLAMASSVQYGMPSEVYMIYRVQSLLGKEDVTYESSWRVTNR